MIDVAPKSETLNQVYSRLKNASLGELRNLHREARMRFDHASTEDDALSAALFMQQIRYTVWKRMHKPDGNRVTPIYIRKEVMKWER